MTKPLWFRARDYGWGWYPMSWQGWTVLAVWFVYILGIVARLDATSSPVRPFVLILTSVAILLAICWKTGERPSWRWAGKPISAWRGIAYTLAIVIGAAALASLVSFTLSR